MPSYRRFRRSRWCVAPSVRPTSRLSSCIPMPRTTRQAGAASASSSSTGPTCVGGRLPRARVAASVAAPPWVAGESPGSRRGGRRAAHLPRDVLYRRRVLHFIDNTVALSKSVHGYAKDPDMAAVVNSLHTCDAALGVDAWFKWVPSHANISDIRVVTRRRGTRRLARSWLPSAPA